VSGKVHPAGLVLFDASGSITDREPASMLAVLYAMDRGNCLSGEHVTNIVSTNPIRAVIHSGSFVGIFWAVPEKRETPVILAHRCSLKEAEPYGGMRTCPHGHHEVWEHWRGGTKGRPDAAASLIATSEYEEWPRGRIVYDAERDRFIIYADGQILRRHDLLAAIHERFGLPRGCAEARPDDHYRGARRLARGRRCDPDRAPWRGV
jgi:hypothetical protein